MDVRVLRQRLGLTREGFATRYGLEVETVRNWKPGLRDPDTTTRSDLRAISNAPGTSSKPTPNPKPLTNQPRVNFQLRPPDAPW